ncbi:hypothetical protein BH23ACT12_BH23ACT12_13980 [soil metagenome]
MSLNTLHKLVEVKESLAGNTITSPKTFAGFRTVPVPGALWDELVTYLGPRINASGGRVFVDPEGGPFVWRRFYRAYQAAVHDLFPLSKGGIVFHSLRHSYTSLLEELEVRPKIMSMVLGHSTGSVTADVYTHVGPKQLAAVGERVNARYLAAMSPTTTTTATRSNLAAVPAPTRHACPHCEGTGWITEAEAANG